MNKKSRGPNAEDCAHILHCVANNSKEDRRKREPKNARLSINSNLPAQLCSWTIYKIIMTSAPPAATTIGSTTCLDHVALSSSVTTCLSFLATAGPASLCCIGATGTASGATTRGQTTSKTPIYAVRYHGGLPMLYDINDEGSGLGALFYILLLVLHTTEIVVLVHKKYREDGFGYGFAYNSHSTSRQNFDGLSLFSFV
ncbi:unnamed protein product [Amoebophrya sp. A120]|nr:unnamed protein product [Amoebophrya sp. A120]|eukprot:GSA120T00000440001.1